ncbi:cingulin-like [Homalodisca vitripennis]|uniref:cingulin-like n=1 Tax=Homalodisca vitripennis TaxID=197043 RepID=UPI001EEA14EC|nr:cingulin-like [Homalodisca vitripennis]
MDEETQEIEPTPQKKMEELLKKMENWSERQIKSKTISKTQLSELNKLVGMMRKELKEMEIEKAKMEGRLEERKEIVNMFKEALKEEGERKSREGAQEEGTTKSFADIVRDERKMKEKRPPAITGKRGEPARSSNVVLVRKEGRESEEVRRKMKELIDPGKERINVKRMTNVKNGILLEVTSKEEVKRLVEDEGMKGEGIEVKAPDKKRPMLMIYDVEMSLKDDEIMKEIYERNLKEEMTEDEMKEGFTIRSRKEEGKGDRRRRIGSIIVQCSAKVRNLLRRRERLYIGWTSNRAKDYIDLPRCYRCQRFGHVAKYCNGKKACPRCSEEHDIKDCRVQEDAPWKCVNCERDGKVDLNHDVRWKGCPAYKRAEKRYLESVAYD